jgi:hypothetical protein
MAAFADQFGPVPIKERSRWLTNLNGMRHSSQAIGASLLLVSKCPIRAQKTKHNGGSGLYIARQMRKRLHEQASQVNGCEINNCDDCRDLGNQKRPKQASSGQRRLV